MIINPILPIPILILMLVLILALPIYLVVRRHKSRSSLIPEIVIALLLLAIGLRPMLPNGVAETQVIKNNLDITLVIDGTGSMIAEDYDGKKTRLEGVKYDTLEITKALHGATFSVISFDNSAYIRVPFTDNKEVIDNSVSSLRPISTFYAKGSDINSPFELLEESLEKRSKKNNNKQIVFYLGDGEQTADTSLKSYSNLKKYIAGGAVLGYGTTTGGKMQEAGDDNGHEPLYIYDYNTGKDAVSKIDEKNLNSIASDFGVNYHHRTTPDSLDSILKPIQSLAEQEATTQGTKKTTIYADIYWIFSGILTIILLIQIVNFISHNNRKKEKS